MKFILATTNKNKLSEINDIAKDYGINFELPQIPFEVDENGETLYENALKKAEFYPKGYPPLYGSTSFHLQEELLVGRSRANASEPVTGNNPLEWKAEPETECKDYAEPNNSVQLIGLHRQGQGNALKKAEFYPKGYPPLYGSTSFHLQEELLVGRSRANASEPNNSELKKQDNFCILSDDTGLFVEALNGAPGIHSARYDTTPEKRIQKLLNALKDEHNRNAKFLCTMVLLDSNGKILITNTGEIKGTITTSTKGVNGFGYDPIFFIEHLNKTMAQLTKEEKNTVSHRAKALIPILEFIKTSVL